MSTPIIPHCIIFPGDLVELISYDHSITRRCGREMNKMRYKTEPGSIGIVTREDSIGGEIIPTESKKVPALELDKILGFRVIFGDKLVFVTSSEVRVLEYGKGTPDAEGREALLEIFVIQAQERERKKQVAQSLVKKLRSLKKETSYATSDKVKIKVDNNHLELMSEILQQMKFLEEDGK